MFRKVLLLALVAVLACSSPLLAEEANRFRYSVSDNPSVDRIDHWYGSSAIRSDMYLGGDLVRSVLYNTDSNTMYRMDHTKKKAVKYTKEGMEEFMQKISNMVRRPLPEESDSSESEQKFVNVESTKWKGLPATRGNVKQDGKVQGSIVLLDNPPLGFSSSQLSTVDSYTNFRAEFFGMAERMTKMFSGRGRGFGLDSIKPLARVPGDKRVIHLAESKHSVGSRPGNFSVELTDWQQEQVEASKFDIPDDYPVMGIEQTMNKMPRMPRGQRGRRR